MVIGGFYFLILADYRMIIYLPEGCVLAGDGIAIYCWRDLRTLQKVIAFVVTVF